MKTILLNFFKIAWSVILIESVILLCAKTITTQVLYCVHSVHNWLIFLTKFLLCLAILYIARIQRCWISVFVTTQFWGLRPKNCVYRSGHTSTEMLHLCTRKLLKFPKLCTQMQHLCTRTKKIVQRWMCFSVRFWKIVHCTRDALQYSCIVSYYPFQ